MTLREIFAGIASIPPSVIVTAGLVVGAAVAATNGAVDTARALGAVAVVTGTIAAVHVAKPS